MDIRFSALYSRFTEQTSVVYKLLCKKVFPGQLNKKLVKFCEGLIYPNNRPHCDVILELA